MRRSTGNRPNYKFFVIIVVLYSCALSLVKVVCQRFLDFLLSTLGATRQNFIGGMRWHWEWSDLVFLCRRTFKKVKLFFSNAKKREEGFHFWLDNFPYYIINIGYITIFYLLRLALTPYLDTGTIFRVYATLLIFYWYGLSIQDDSAWFAHFGSYILTFLIFLALLKFFSIYTAVGLILMFRPLAINLSLMTIILGSLGIRKILTFFRFLWERLVKNKNDN